MKATTQAEGRTYYLNWELQKAAEKMLREIMLVKPGETVLITCDTTNDERVINATAGAALTMGAYPIVMQYPASLEQAIMIEPTKPVLEAIKAADVWIEYDYQLFYTRGWKQAMDCGTRQITAASMDINMMLNVIGRFDHKKIVELGERLVVLHNEAKQMRITSPGGTDLTFCLRGPSVQPVRHLCRSRHLGYALRPDLHVSRRGDHQRHHCLRRRPVPAPGDWPPGQPGQADH